MPVNIEQKTLTSVEVAEMVGKPHNDLMKDIRRYTSQFNEGNISHVEFFTENTYLDKKGQERPCYLVTKKGCEFIAHKLTGVKGTEFTAKYINRFHELEEHVQKPRTALEQIALLAQGALELEEKVDSVEQEVYSIKNDMPLFGAESDELSAHVKRKGVEMLGGKKSEAYKDNKVRQTVYRDIYSQLKRKDLADAHEFIDCYTLPSYLQDVITNCNAQIRMDGDLCGV